MSASCGMDFCLIASPWGPAQQSAHKRRFVPCRGESQWQQLIVFDLLDYSVSPLHENSEWLAICCFFVVGRNAAAALRGDTKAGRSDKCIISVIESMQWGHSQVFGGLFFSNQISPPPRPSHAISSLLIKQNDHVVSIPILLKQMSQGLAYGRGTSQPIVLSPVFHGKCILEAFLHFWKNWLDWQSHLNFPNALQWVSVIPKFSPFPARHICCLYLKRHFCYTSE